MTIPIEIPNRDLRRCLKCRVIVGYFTAPTGKGLFGAPTGSDFVELPSCAIPHGSEYRCVLHPQVKAAAR